MDGMSYAYWEGESQLGEDQSQVIVTKDVNLPPTAVIAELTVSGFIALLQAAYDHDIFCGFTGCTWADGSGTHVEDFIHPFTFPHLLARNGLTKLSYEVDMANVIGRVILNVFYWPSVT